MNGAPGCDGVGPLALGSVAFGIGVREPMLDEGNVMNAVTFVCMETWVRRACRQRAYRQFVTWLLIAAGAVAVNFAFKTYWTNFLEGPYQVTSAGLAHSSADPDRQFVAVTGSRVLDSGIQEVTTESQNGVKQSTYVSSKYFVLLVGEDLLVVKRNEQPPLHVDGELTQLPSNLPNLIFPDDSDSLLRQRIYPLMLDSTGNYRLPGYIAIATELVFGFLFWRLALPRFREMQDVTLHPVVKRVEGWAESSDVVLQVEREMTNAVRFKKAGIVVTENYVIVRSFYGFNILPLDHLLWAYRKVTTRLVNFIPVARTSEAILVFYGGSASFPSRKKVVEEVLYYALHRAPWAFVGHTQELSRAFKKETNAFCAAVEARREQWIEQFRVVP